MTHRIPSTLYHGTGILQLAQILATGRFEASPPDDHDDSGVHGFSLTSDEDVAKKFAAEAKDRDWDGTWRSPVVDDVVLELDGRLLSETVDLVRISWDGSTSEAEFRTRGDVGDATKSIRRVKLDPVSCLWWIEAMREGGMDEAADALAALPMSLVVAGDEVQPMQRSDTMGDHLGMSIRDGGP